MRRLAPFLAMAIVIGSAGCRSEAPLPPAPDRLWFAGSTGNVVLNVEIASSPQERQQGLMGREELPPDRGMIFLFDGPTGTTFWMKDTLIPLSIAFWDSRYRIVTILDMDPCRADSCRAYASDMPYVGAVEVNRGYFEERGVRVGDSVTLEIVND